MTTSNHYQWNNDDSYGVMAQEVEYVLHEPKEPNAISLMMAGSDEMLRITEEGFWVRGKKVEQDDKEAEVVYNAFKQWLAWANLQR